MSCECPLKKWVAELDEVQEEHLDKFIEDYENNNSTDK